MLFITHIVEKKTTSSPYEVPHSEQSGGGVTVEIKNNRRRLLPSF